MSWAAVERDHCDGRPASRHRAVFLKATAPYGPVTAATVGGIGALACDRAGLARFSRTGCVTWWRARPYGRAPRCQRSPSSSVTLRSSGTPKPAGWPPALRRRRRQRPLDAAHLLRERPALLGPAHQPHRPPPQGHPQDRRRLLHLAAHVSPRPLRLDATWPWTPDLLPGHQTTPVPVGRSAQSSRSTRTCGGARLRPMSAAERWCRTSRFARCSGGAADGS
jgi:hypothetical protein